jgi:hypothetical protein
MNKMNTVTISKDGTGIGSSDTADAAATAKRDAPPSRRSLFTRAAAALAGCAALVLLGTRTAHAEGETMAVGEEYNDATSTTGVKTTSGSGLSGATSDANGAGVLGICLGVGGAGVLGESSGSNPGVLGVSTGSGPGVHAKNANPAAGIALAVTGRVTFSTSGIASIAKGAESVKVMLNGTTSASMVLATLQGLDRGNYLAGVVPATNSFTIYLNSPAGESVKVAWFRID